METGLPGPQAMENNLRAASSSGFQIYSSFARKRFLLVFPDDRLCMYNLPGLGGQWGAGEEGGIMVNESLDQSH